MLNRNRPTDSRLIVRQSGRVASFLFSIIILAAALGVFFYRQDIKDWLVLRSYQPTAAIKQLADDASLSDRGRSTFYETQPELHQKSDFSQKCNAAGDENSNVLGCYTAQRIYIYDVQDPQLSGVREVTAAHEMLHAAYERLSPGEQARVNGLVQKQLDTQVDGHIKELINLYNRLEPGQLLNEMHSILGTEQVALSPELESYYSQYFTNRKKVVSLSEAYRAVFDDLKAKQSSLIKELDSLAVTINNTTESLNNDVQSFNSEVQAFNARASSGSMTQADFESQRAALLNSKEGLALRRQQNDALRQQYETKRQSYNSLGTEFNNLQEKINSKPNPLTDVH